LADAEIFRYISEEKCMMSIPKLNIVREDDKHDLKMVLVFLFGAAVFAITLLTWLKIS
jgi:hypothetical protein